MSNTSPAEAAKVVREQIPPGGLFAGQDWRISPVAFSLGAELTKELETLGRVLLQFNRAVNLLYRKSLEGKQPAWISRLFDQGKPSGIVALQRHPAFKNELPRVIRPDILLTEDGVSITELDSVPGGIGLTAWLGQVYSRMGGADGDTGIIGGADGMLNGFAGIFGDAKAVHVVVSEEASTYRPEMVWLANQLAHSKFKIQNTEFEGFAGGDAVYRFFEMFDLENVANAQQLFTLAQEKSIRLTPPPKPIFEEKLLFALLWNRNLREFWRHELGENFLNRLQKAVPYTWIVDPTPLPPHGGIPGLEITDWQQLKTFSQRERELILKISGFAATAWGARGVYLGSDLSQAEWSAAIDLAIRSYAQSPFVLQRFHKPKTVASEWFDFERNMVVSMPGRVRLCPYYFVEGENDSMRANLGGVLATICPADKKIIHGMRDAILAPCSR